MNNEIDILISPNHNATNACLIAYFTPFWGSGPYLFSDDLTSWSSIQFGDSASNSQCQLMGGVSEGVRDSTIFFNNGTPWTSTSVTMNLKMKFFSSFVGQNFIDENLTDQWGTTGWGTLGNFTVAGLPIITTMCGDIPFGVVGKQYSTQLQVQGSKSPYTWSVQTGTLPPGIGLSTAGLLSGAPSQSGNFALSFGVRDAAGYAAASPTCKLNVITQAQMTTQTGTASPAASFAAAATRIGVYRSGQGFLEDSDGNGYGPYPSDKSDVLKGFTPPGGVVQGDIPMTGDWTGDGHAKAGFYRPTTGTWWLDWNDNGVFDNGDKTYQFGGIPGDMPVAGDWNGLGKDCVGLFRLGAFWVLDNDCNGVFEGTGGSPYPDRFFGFGGIVSDVPVVGKWAGGKTRAGVVRCYFTGGSTCDPLGPYPFYWVLDGADTSGDTSTATHQPGYTFAFGGLAGDKFVAGNWSNVANGDPSGISAAGVYRPSVGYWLLDNALVTNPNQSSHTIGTQFGYGGVPTDLPITGKWAPVLYYVTTTSPPNGVVGGYYSQTLSATGGTPPYHWSATALPPGLTVSGAGTLSGTPTSAGSYVPSLTVTDSASATTGVIVSFAIQDFTLSQPSPVTVVQGGASVVFTLSSSATTGSSGTINLTVNPPQGIAVSFSPSSINMGGSSTVTVSAPIGQGSTTVNSPLVVTLPIAATWTSQAGQVTKVPSVPITVNPYPTFTIGAPSVNPVVLQSAAPGSQVTFTQTITGHNGFNGPVSLTPSAVFYTNVSGQLVQLSNGSDGPITLRYNPSIPNLSPSANTATVAGTLTVNSWPGGLPANASAYTFWYTFSGTPSYGAGNYPATTTTIAVPAIMGAVPPFIISGIPATTAVYATGSGGAGTPATVMVNPVNGSTPSSITFSLSSGGFTVQTTVNHAPSATPWPATFNINAATSAQSGLITINASAGSAGTVPFSMSVNVYPPFNLSASPNSQIANVAGCASYQINVSGITGQVALSVSSAPGLPTGSSLNINQSTITAPGVSLLSVTVPPMTSQTTYNLTVSATSGSLGTSVTVPLFVNPLANTAPATMISPASGWNLTGSAATFTWSSGVGVSQYQLLVGSSPGASDYFAVNTGASRTASASWPGGSQQIYVTLGSNISGSWRSNSYVYAAYPQSSDVATGDATPSSQGGNYVYNDNQELIYTYNETNGGDDSEYVSCTSADPNVKARLVSTSPTSMQIGYTAYFNATTGNKAVTCDWEYTAPNGRKVSYPSLPVAGGITVYDATPTITTVNPTATLYPGQSGYITIWGKNFGAAGTANSLVFTPSVGSCGNSRDITYQIVQPLDWGSLATEQARDLDQINAFVTATPNACAGGSYDVQVTSGGVTGNGFQANPQGGSKAQSTAAHAVDTIQVLMKLELDQPANPTTISNDGSYTEDTTIRVTAVRSNGTTLTDFTGDVEIAENSDPDYLLVYNQFPQQEWPLTAHISTGGTTTVVARSEALSADQKTKPNDGQVVVSACTVDVRTNCFNMYGTKPLVIPQWVITNQVDVQALPGTYDWMAAHARKILNGAKGDDATVLFSVAMYYQVFIPANPLATGLANPTHSLRSYVGLNPWADGMRDDVSTSGPCGYGGDNYTFTGTLYHEARHAYQYTLATIGVDNDQDFLILDNVTGYPAATTIKDSSDPRDVCDASGSGQIVRNKPYKGDNVPELLGNPDWVSWALEKDAYDFQAHRAIQH